MGIPSTSSAFTLATHIPVAGLPAPQTCNRPADDDGVTCLDGVVIGSSAGQICQQHIACPKHVVPVGDELPIVVRFLVDVEVVEVLSIGQVRVVACKRHTSAQITGLSSSALPRPEKSGDDWYSSTLAH